ncbi:hypothetical protein PENTCL1PPCAC_17346, partial [Pristionchus entomophagus]
LSVSYMGTIGSIAVVLSVFLFRAVWRHHIPSMKVYSILIVNTAIVNLIGSLSMITVFKREMSTPFGILVVCNSFGPSIDIRLCWICFG